MLEIDSYSDYKNRTEPNIWYLAMKIRSNVFISADKEEVIKKQRRPEHLIYYQNVSSAIKYEQNVFHYARRSSYQLMQEWQG